MIIFGAKREPVFFPVLILFFSYLYAVHDGSVHTFLCWRGGEGGVVASDRPKPLFGPRSCLRLLVFLDAAAVYQQTISLFIDDIY